MSFCSRAALAANEVAAGTGVSADAYVFLPVPKRLWGDSEINSSWASHAEVEAIRAGRKGRVVSRLYNPPRDAAPAETPILVHSASREPPALEPLLKAFAARWGVDRAPSPRLALCTQGTRDRCCAKWGFAVYNAALRLYEAGLSPFQPIESSHMGGDRFAATGIFFPSGSMYAHLDSVDLQALVTAEASGRLAPEWYRGRVFEPALTQVVRAGLARDGRLTTACDPLSLEVLTGGQLRVMADSQAFLVSVTEAEFDFYPDCSRMAQGRPSRTRRKVYVGSEPLMSGA